MSQCWRELASSSVRGNVGDVLRPAWPASHFLRETLPLRRGIPSSWWWSAVRRPSKDVPCGNLFAKPHTIQPSTLLCVKNLYFVGKDPGTAACMSCSIWITAPPHSIQLKSFQAVQLNASEPFLFSETFARILPASRPTDCQSSGPIWFPSSGRPV